MDSQESQVSIACRIRQLAAGSDGDDDVAYRHIGLDGDLLYVANERSHQVMVLRIDPATGIPAAERSIDVPSPTVVLL